MDVAQDAHEPKLVGGPEPHAARDGRTAEATRSGHSPAWTSQFGGDLGVTAAQRNVTPPVPVRVRQITPNNFLYHIPNTLRDAIAERKEFVVNANTAAGEARESSLARPA